MEEHHHHSHHYMPGEFGRKILLTLAGILMVYSAVFLATLIRNNVQKYRFIGKADRLERTIRVEAQGKVNARPDIAMVTLGMTATSPTVAEAQQKNTAVMNSLIEKLKAMDIQEADIQTADYSIEPQYVYSEKEGSKVTGYTVSQQVNIKIRDLTKSNEVLAVAGQVGVNKVSGLTFTIDDKESYKAEARQIALDKIADKAKTLSEMLGVDVVSVISYEEYEGDPVPLPLYRDFDAGIGGNGAAPNVQSGSMDIVVNAAVVLEIQ